MEYRFVPDFRIVNSTSRVKRVTEFGTRFNTIKLRLVKFAGISFNSRNFKEIKWNSFDLRSSRIRLKFPSVGASSLKILFISISN